MRPATRSVPPDSQFGQRPLFSRADESPGPATAAVPPEARLDDVVPIDRGPGSQFHADGLGPGPLAPTFLIDSRDNVGSPPTEAEIETAFGARSTGFTGIIVDGGGAGKMWLCIKFHQYWHFVGATRAT